MSCPPENWRGALRNVIVTGGSRGIGLEIVRTLSRAGYGVIAIARTSGEALPLLMGDPDSCSPGQVRFQAADLADIAAIPSMVKSVRQQFGPIYGLVNNAGLGTPGVLANMPDSQIERLVQLNVLSPLTLTRHVVRSMLAAGAGRIVNISSIVASTGYPGLSVYSATKASLVGFTHSLAREVGSVGITVNAIAPGFIATEMTQDLTEGQRQQISRRSALRRLPETSDIADAVEFLLSEKARNITGTVLTVDAGSTA
jgi:3-oxoacyl-[acyl-carrier protein] reductase